MSKAVNLLTIHPAEEAYTSAGNPSGYRIRIEHGGIEEAKTLSARRIEDLNDKVELQISRWNTKWEKLQQLQTVQEKADIAKAATEDARSQLNLLEKILAHTLDVDDTLNWDRLLVSVDYNLPPPKKPKKLKAASSAPSKPAESAIVKPCPVLKKLFGGQKKWDLSQAIIYEQVLSEWRKQIKAAKLAKERKEKTHADSFAEYESRNFKWEENKTKFVEKQSKKNAAIDSLKEHYFANQTEATEEYCRLVLDASDYPDYFQKASDVEYLKDSKTLLLDFQLPNLEQIPKKVSTRYVKARDAFEEKYLSAAQHDKLFDSVVYQIVLRTIHELFEADAANAIDCIILNGMVTALSTSTGQIQTSVIVSITTTKTQFSAINLAAVDPKACFKSLKGVGSAKLSGITPVAPLASLSTSDKRFRDHYEVADGLDAATNLASMHWEDFEHLVRELFEKEFGANGSEVKVTQASSDGGVDAIAFDPDPIRGGKIIIQAKRYTNTVGVSAVRDLYGTVMNEGANKGILVSTADFGPDSYNFVKDKPLTLLNGANLLSLLWKHGHKAKIDIRAAKLELASSS